MTPIEILEQLNLTSPYRPNGKCHFCGEATPAHSATCIWLEVANYENLAVRVVELQQLAFLLVNGATVVKDAYGAKVHIEKDVRVTPALRRLAERLGITVVNGELL